MLPKIIPLLEAMPHDELRDFIDYCEFIYLAQLIPANNRDGQRARNRFKKQVKNRRAGLPTGGFPDAWIKEIRGTKTLTMTTERQKKSLKLINQASPDELITILGKPISSEPDNEDASTGKDKKEPRPDRTAAAIAWAFLRAKAPQRLNSEGNIQVKKIPYQRVVIDEETGKPAKDEDGNIIKITVMGLYLYLRYWQVQGDGTAGRRKKTRYKSLYIGGETPLAERGKGGYKYRLLAEHFASLIEEHGKLIIQNEGKPNERRYKRRPSGDDNPIANLEQRIIACIDLETVDTKGKRAINHEKLEALQIEVC